MKIKFIGTGSGKTSLERFHSSFVIFSNASNLLFDAGDSVSRALLSSGIKFNQIDTIVLSHYHADHFAGIGSLITQMKLIDREKELSIFTHKSLIEPLRYFLRTVYMFDEVMDFKLNIIGFDSNEKVETTDGIFFTARQNTHITNKHSVNAPSVSFISHSFLFEVNGKNIFASSDIGSKEDLYLFKEYKLDAAILEITHIELEEVLEFYQSVNPEKVFLTHIDDEDVKDIIAAIEKNSRIAGAVQLASDGLLVEL